MPHALLKRYPSLYDLVYISSYLYESEAFQKLHYQDSTPPWSAMSKMYLTAADEDFIWRQGLSPANSRTAERMLITTRFMLAPDDPMLLLCIRNRKPEARSPWYAERFIPRSEFERAGQFAGIPEGEWLRNWAVIRLGESHDYFGALQELAKMTHSDERWYFGQNEDRHYPILGNYLRYTFYKLWLDQCVCYSADGQMASFNTGLVSNKYEYIYAVFEHIQPQNGKFWSLKGFCIAGEQGLGKEFLRQFNPIPRPARFFSRTSELIYEIDYDLPMERQMPFVDYNHVIHDNLSRFPLTFLQNICFGYQDILSLLELIPKADSNLAMEQLWEKIDRLLDDELFLRIKAQIERAVRIAIRRAIWNYKTAIPVYFPARDALSWLLPLALNPGSQADVALVVERFPNGNLEGHTVLDLDMAYTNARLVSKPESDWLRPTAIEMGLETRLEIQNEQPDPAPPSWPCAPSEAQNEPALQEKSPEAPAVEKSHGQEKRPAIDQPKETVSRQAKQGKKAATPSSKAKESSLVKITNALEILNRQRGMPTDRQSKKPTSTAKSQLTASPQGTEESAAASASRPAGRKGAAKAAAPEQAKSQKNRRGKENASTAKAAERPATEKSAKPSHPKTSRSPKPASAPKQKPPEKSGPTTGAQQQEKKISRSLIGQEVSLEQVSLRKGHRGIQGIYQGIVVTIAPGAMRQPPESYLEKQFKVKLVRVNPQGTQYIGRIVEE